MSLLQHLPSHNTPLMLCTYSAHCSPCSCRQLPGNSANGINPVPFSKLFFFSPFSRQLGNTQSLILTQRPDWICSTQILFSAPVKLDVIQPHRRKLFKSRQCWYLPLSEARKVALYILFCTYIDSLSKTAVVVICPLTGSIFNQLAGSESLEYLCVWLQDVIYVPA